MLNIKTSLRMSYNHFKNIHLSKVDRILHTSWSNPSIVCMMITSKCNSRCKQCDMWKRKPTKELNTDQWKKAILNLKKWIGPFYLNIFGGEPFLREDLFELIYFAHNQGIFTDVITNGLLLSADKIDRICDSGLSKLTVSLDGVYPETHDFLKGKGSFKRVMPAIKLLRKRKKDLIITINTIMLKQNLHELPLLVKFVKKNGFNGIFLRILCWEGFNKDYSKNWFLTNPLWPNKTNEAEKILDELIRLKQEGYPIINSVKYLHLAKEYFKNPDVIRSKDIQCLSPYQCVSIYPGGQVKVCSRFNIGNILERDSSTVWKSKRVKCLKQKLLDCKKSCMLRDWFFEDTVLSKLSRAKISLWGH